MFVLSANLVDTLGSDHDTEFAQQIRSPSLWYHTVVYGAVFESHKIRFTSQLFMKSGNSGADLKMQIRWLPGAYIRAMNFSIESLRGESCQNCGQKKYFS